MSIKSQHAMIPNLKTLVAPALLLMGAISLVTAALYCSYILEFIGIALAFWGSLFLYIAIKHVPLELLNATAISPLHNIERILSNNRITPKGIYLSPKYVPSLDFSLVFVPIVGREELPEPKEIDENAIYSRDNSGLVLIAPGFALSKMFEEKLKISFTKLTLEEMLEKLPNLLVEKMEIANKIDINKQGNTIIIKATSHLLKELCDEMSCLPITHQTLGCTFTSAIACALAKAAGKPVLISREEQQQKGKITKVSYLIIDK
jgi:hypothetical protein